MYRLLIALGILTLSLSCGGSKKLFSGAGVEQAFADHFTGYVVMDPKTGTVLQALNADHYFTPASNIKLFTFYTALQVLPEKLAAFQTYHNGIHTYVRGTGYPLFPFPGKPADLQAIIDLRNLPGDTLFLVSDHMESLKYGPGWAWDDQQFSFQSERSALSLYRNCLQLSRANILQPIRVYPGTFEVITDRSLDRPKHGADGRTIYLPGSIDTLQEVSLLIPFRATDSIFCALLEDRIERPIRPAESLPAQQLTQGTIWAPGEIDTLYKYILQDSDNHLAEQLLLHCSSYLFDTLSIEKMIAYAQEELLGFLTDPPVWVDGSGLSRYNLATPRSIAELLIQLYQNEEEERLLHLFPAGGETGTIKEWYVSTTPYVFAKTGTLRNHHCLSGYLRARSGKLLVFSFMHDNFTGTNAEVKAQMESVLRAMYQKY
jgi:D-alanyl-D-alanine carboxypeptidase/D-alanyl-D-alanine-endopeptidase (penicillin-binding protein 4)